jgi:hypothetical protein
MNPMERASAEELLSHPFLMSECNCELIKSKLELIFAIDSLKYGGLF